MQMRRVRLYEPFVPRTKRGREHSLSQQFNESLDRLFLSFLLDIVILLAIFDNELKSGENTGKYFADIHPWTENAPSLPLQVSAKAEWESLSSHIQNGLIIIDPLQPSAKRRKGGNKTWRQHKNKRTTWRR